MVEVIGPVFLLLVFVAGISIFLHFVPLGLRIAAARRNSTQP